MMHGRFVLRMMVAATFLLSGIWAAGHLASAQDKKEKEPEKKKGTIVGLLTAKGENWIEVKADGEEKGRRYVPHWVGGQPKDGGGPDKKMLAVIKDLKVGSRIRLEWEFEERPRVLKVEVLKAPKDDKPAKDK